MSRFVTRVGAVGILLALTASACGNSGVRSFSISADGEGDDLEYSARGSVGAGIVEIRFTNSTDSQASAQLVRVEDDQTIDEVLDVVGAEGTVIPDWLSGAGGVGATEPGETRTATVRLTEGIYWVFDDSGPEEDSLANARRGLAHRFLVQGDTGDAELPQTAETMVADEYSFEMPDLNPGLNTFEFQNAGDEHHHFVAFPITGRATVRQVTEYLSSEQPPEGPPPVDFDKAVNVAVIDGGMSQVVEAEFERGYYAFFCFITDRAGGPPHFMQGMTAEAEVS